MQKRIYFDNAATTPIAEEVVETMLPVLRHQFGNPSSIHHEGRTMRAAIETARKTVAQAIGASSAEIFFTSGGTESNNTALKCAVRDLNVTRIISSPIEHHCGMHTFDSLCKIGISIVYLPVSERGQIDLDALQAALESPNEGKTLVSLMHANNEIGTMIDLEAVTALCAENQAYFHSDTVQTIGHIPINVQKYPIHFLSGAAHKFHGPKGVGFLYVNGDVPLKPFIDGGAQERNMRAGTENVYGIIGLAKALEMAIQNMDAHMQQCTDLRNYMKACLLREIPGVSFVGDVANYSLPTVLSVSLPPNPKSEMFLFLLDMAGISASGGSACSSGAEKGSHVLEALKLPTDRRVIRFSFSHYNTMEEVNFVVEKVKDIVG